MHEDKIRQFVLAEKKDWCRPVDTAIMVYLMTICNEQGACRPTQAEISKAVGGGDINLSGIRNSLERLVEHKWLWRSADKKAVGQRNIYAVEFNNLPIPQPELFHRKEDGEQTTT